MKTVVVKIGGSLLGSIEEYFNVAKRLEKEFIRKGFKLVVVVSAAKGVTDSLVKVVEVGEGLEEVHEKYLEMASNLSSTIKYKVAVKLAELDEKARLGNLNSYVKARILAYGEEISRIILGSILDYIGLRVVEVSALDIVKARGNPLNARIDYSSTSRLVNTAIPKILGEVDVVVVEGFIASNSDGQVVVLGRGGSDYTATTLASLLGVDAYLLSNVPGILSGNPEHVGSVRKVPVLDYDEAVEAAIHGAKKLHPRTFEPLKHLDNHGIRVYVGGLNNSYTTVVPWTTSPSLKLTASRSNRNSSIVALIGKCNNRLRVAKKLVEELAENNIEYIGLHVPPNRPVIRVVVPRRQVVEATRIAHEIVVGGGYD